MVASAAPPADGANQVAVLLVMDNSGSMSTSDPSRLRLTASRLFVSLLDQGDAVGVIRFSTPVTRLTDKITPIQNEPDKKSIIQKITVEDPNGWTHVKEAFDEAKKMLAELQGVVPQ